MAEELCVQLVPLFQELSLANQRQVEKLVHHKHALKGNVLASPDKSDCLVIIEYGSAKMYQLRQQNQLIGLPNIEERVTNYLQLLKSRQHSSDIVLPLKLKDLASYLGTTPETISRQLKSLEQKNYLIKRSKRIKLLA